MQAPVQKDRFMRAPSPGSSSLRRSDRTNRAARRRTKSRGRPGGRRRRLQRLRIDRGQGFEPLEERVVLDAAPNAFPDSYVTPLNTALTLSASNDLFENDWDAEGSTLTAAIVDSPANGTISSFSGSAGTLTYTPDNGFNGVDVFSYKINDGTSDSSTVKVQVAVGKYLGAQTNLEELPRRAVASYFLEKPRRRRSKTSVERQAR